MKSAYELAMERLEKESGPSKKLSQGQKDRIAAIDKQFDAKIAELKLHYEPKVATADFHEIEQVREEMGKAIQDAEDRREREKQAVWNEA